MPAQPGVLHRLRDLVRLVLRFELTDGGADRPLVCVHRGLIGPSRQFGPTSIYYPQIYAVIIGVFLPIPLWYWQKRFPNDWNKFLSTPVILNAITYVPPATGINYSSWILVGFIFQYWIRRKNLAWWTKFNYVTSAAMDIGALLCVRSNDQVLMGVWICRHVVQLAVRVLHAAVPERRQHSPALVGQRCLAKQYVPCDFFSRGNNGR